MNTAKVVHFESKAKKRVIGLMGTNIVARDVSSKLQRVIKVSNDSYQALARVFDRVPLPKIVDQDISLLLDHDGDCLDLVLHEVSVLRRIPPSLLGHAQRAIVICFGETSRSSKDDASRLTDQYAIALVARLHRLAEACSSIRLLPDAPHRHLRLV